MFPAIRVVALAGLAAALACDTTTMPLEPPVDGNGALAGTVVLLGSDDLPKPAAVRVSLFATLADYEVRRTSYEVALRADDLSGRYTFTFPNVAPGTYFLIACWDFGCGDYRNRITGELIPVRIEGGTVTAIHFTL